MLRILKALGLFVAALMVAVLGAAACDLAEHYCGVIACGSATMVLLLVGCWWVVGPTCDHAWEEKGSSLFDFGRNKMFFYQCFKCGKKKTTFLS